MNVNITRRALAMIGGDEGIPEFTTLWNSNGRQPCAPIVERWHLQGMTKHYANLIARYLCLPSARSLPPLRPVPTPRVVVEEGRIQDLEALLRLQGGMITNLRKEIAVIAGRDWRQVGSNESVAHVV